MLKNLIAAFIFSVSLGASLQTFGQSVAKPKPAPGATIERRDTDDTPQDSNKPATKATPKPTPRQTNTASPTSGVLAAFNKLVDGIRASDVDAVMSVFWKSPQLTLFNYNGTVTKTWDQVSANRSSSYPNAKNVKLDVRDVKIQMLGTNAALVTCLWTQTQDYKDKPESSSGRLTLVFKQIGGAWKIIHTHTSPDAPDPSRLPPSEKNEPSNTVAPTTKPPTTRTPKPLKPPAPKTPQVKPN